MNTISELNSLLHNSKVWLYYVVQYAEKINFDTNSGFSVLIISETNRQHEYLHQNNN